MEKTITLNETQMELLRLFLSADDSLRKSQACIEATSPTLDPWNFDEAKKQFDAAFSTRISIALGFAMCVAADFVAEQGQQVNPIETSSDEKSDKNRGLYRKFNVKRTDGSSAPGGKHERCKYFVIDLTHDVHAPAALMAYAESCRFDYPQLADDIVDLFV